VPLPQTRPLTDTTGTRWLVTVDRGRLVLTRSDGETWTFTDPTELRSLSPQLTRAVTEHTLDQQETAAKELAARRLLRKRAGEPAGLLHRPFVEPGEPAMNLDPLVRQESA
jgi:hypothetical protein